MRYLEYTLTLSSSKKSAISPIEAFTEEIRLATSWSSRNEKKIQEPKYLKWGQNVTLPFATAICFFSVSASMGEIVAFLDDDHVNVSSKYLIFCTIPCSLILWGCESCALRQTLLDALEVLLHWSVRQILRIQVGHVIEHWIRNEHVHEFFLTYRRFETKLPFVNSLTSGKLSEEKVLTFPHASSQRGASILKKWEDHYSQTSSASSEISNLSYLKSMTMVP